MKKLKFILFIGIVPFFLLSVGLWDMCGTMCPTAQPLEPQWFAVYRGTVGHKKQIFTDNFYTYKIMYENTHIHALYNAVFFVPQSHATI